MQMLTDLHAAFEAQLHAAWEARDFSAWLRDRLVYADWLEENDHPLSRMARCPVRMSPRHDFERPLHSCKLWMWRLYFDFPADWHKPRPCWWANQRMNAQQMLGFPPYTLRCKGWEKETRTLRFTLVFRPHAATRWVSRRRYDLSGFDEKPAARDIIPHRDGFAACFWRPFADAPHDVTPNDIPRRAGCRVYRGVR